MRFLAVNLGELNPHADADRWFIWVQAVAEFLWPDKRYDSVCAEIIQHPMFLSWCDDLGDTLGIIDGAVVKHLYPDEFSWDVRQAKELVRYSELGLDGGAAIAAELDRLWGQSWAALTVPDSGGVGIVPQARWAGRGLKLCLLVNVLRYGVHTGTPPMGGLHELVKWADAVDAASLHLALSIFWTIGNGKNSEFNPPVISWEGVQEAAASKEACCGSGLTDLKELREHAPGEGIEGFRKRLRATMDEDSFRRVSLLAADFEKQGMKCGKSSLGGWRKKSGISNWFADTK